MGRQKTIIDRGHAIGLRNLEKIIDIPLRFFLHFRNYIPNLSVFFFEIKNCK